jgi:predicted nuclease with TOPRIM domain
MEATLNNLQRSSQESHSKLDSTIKEIASLQQNLAELRTKLEEAHKDRGSVEALTIHTLQYQLHFD